MSYNNHTNHNEDGKKKKVPPPPSFAGPRMDDGVGICFDNDLDIGAETSRRIGGAGFGFTPSNITFETPSMAPQSHTGMFSTAAVKAQAMPAPKFMWALLDAPTLPERHTLERTAVFVPHSQTCHDVAGRISNVLRDRSIEASFDDDKARAKCMTSDGVDFRVRLYRGRNQYSHGVIVEVQRRCGTSIHFQGDCQAILNAAEGKKAVPPPRMMTMPAALPLVPQDDDYQPRAGSSLARVSRLLAIPGYDAQSLALQTLTSLTDPAKVGSATSQSVSRELLSGNNQVGTKLLGLILVTPPTVDHGLEDDDDDDAFEVRVKAMNVLANVLQVVSSTVPDSIKMQLRPVLKQDLQRAASSPRLATIAARCVEYLIDESAYDIYHDALEAAVQVGSERHAGLMRQAERCLQKLGAR